MGGWTTTAHPINVCVCVNILMATEGFRFIVQRFRFMAGRFIDPTAVMLGWECISSLE